MTKEQIKCCDYILSNGLCFSDKQFISEDDVKIRQFVVELDNEEYHLTKWNDEWVYLFHSIKKHDNIGNIQPNVDDNLFI